MGSSLFRFGIVVLFAFNLRTNLANFSPLVETIRQDLVLGAVAVSVIGFLPPAAFAAAALLGQPLTSRFGLSRATQFAMWAVVLGSLVRAVAIDVISFALATALALAGAGLGNVLLPVMTREVGKHRLTALTNANGIVFAIATAIPIFLALPLAEVIGWRGSLALWAAPALLFLLIWRRQSSIWKISEPRIPGEKARHHIARQTKSPHAWLTAGVFGVSGFIVYSVFIWFPIFLTDLAVTTEREAANAVTAFALAGVLIYATIPLSSVLRIPASLLLAMGFVLFGGFILAVLFAPSDQIFWWFVVGGVGPIVFPVILISIARQHRLSASDVGFSSFVQGVGYFLGSIGPLLTGALYTQSGSATLPLVFLLGVAVVGLVLVAFLHGVDEGTRTRL